jgi:hypothetical protein
VALDPKHLPEDPKVLQQMVLDLMAQLDREFTERNKVEALLRELLDAKRNRKSEQLSADQLALFAELLQAQQAQAESPGKGDDSDIRRGVFRSVADLQASIEAFLTAWNQNPKPFVWTATVESIQEKLTRCRRTLEQIQPGCTSPKSRKRKQ